MLKSVYRNAWQCAILLLCSAIGVSAQSSRAPKISKGPLALGLVQLGGKSARLIPVVIMVDGTLYDASVYRATPRPMALEPGTVYEVQRSGSPVGLFTVGDAQQIGETWYGLGDWQPAGAAQQAKAAPPSRSSASSMEDQPPILRRSGGGPGSNSPPAGSTPPTPNQGPGSSDDSAKPDSSKSGSSSTSTQPAPSSEGDQPPILRRPSTTSSNSPTAIPPSPANSSPTTSQEDSNRPLLRRGKPAPEGPLTAAGKSGTANSLGTMTQAGSGAGSPKGSALQLLPAVSDAAGPEARAFTFFFKPGEEPQFQKRLQAIARREINTYERIQQPNLVATELQPGTFHALDLDFSNQPVFVYTAQTTLVARASSARAGSGRRSAKPSQEGGISNAGAATAQHVDAYTTVVARVDIYGDLKEIFSSVTDSRHLDEIPRLELIDAVDVDGDERGELLFSELTDAGHVYVIYRVTPNHLTKLFDSSGVGQ